MVAESPQSAIPADTIAAVSTAAGSSARGIVRLSGPQAFDIVGSLLAEPQPRLDAPRPYSACPASLRLRPGGPRVPATLYLMPAPRSYTRDHVAEIHTLGSPPLLAMVLDALVEHGARLAEPGEFTRRAFLAGRIDLAQAEAVLAIIQARSASEQRAATRALTGHHSRHIHELAEALVGLRAQVEASIDFAEHGLDLFRQADLLEALADALATVGDELTNADSGSLPPEGIRVALCGLPNAGKSSLFNALLARDRSIVTDVPGTTRDAVAEPLTLDGIPFRLYDTAGLAHPPSATGEPDALPGPWFLPHDDGRDDEADAIDIEAAARARGLIGGTHIALVVVDASQPLGEAERELWAEIDAPHKILVLNKGDLAARVDDSAVAELAAGASVFHTSAATGKGVGELATALVNIVRAGQVDASPADLVWNARHRHALRRAREALERARTAAEDELGAEFVAVDLRDAHAALGTITGEVVAEDILDVIFAEFCIGK